MKIGEVLRHLGTREIPCVGMDTGIDEVIHVLVGFPHSRIAYVVDEEGRVVGTITLGSLLRHIFPYHYEGRLHARDLLRRITAETARNIMDKNDVHATPDETADDVLERMASTGVKEMAVVDAEGRIIGDLTAIDLLRHYHLKTQDAD